MTARVPRDRKTAKAYGLLLGVGFGALIDGIVLHQVLQWHRLISHIEPMSTVSGLEANTLADGLFHIVAWATAFAGSVGTVAAWRQGRLTPNWSLHFGLVVGGIGIFNVFDGVASHLLLGAHHVRDDLGAPFGWDAGFLVLALLLVVAGWLLYRRGLRALGRAEDGRTLPTATDPAAGGATRPGAVGE
jgi:uncharacterized membrane protein